MGMTQNLKRLMEIGLIQGGPWPALGLAWHSAAEGFVSAGEAGPRLSQPTQSTCKLDLSQY
jgi:hypothetical protein